MKKKTLKLKLWQNSKIQIVTKLRNSNWNKTLNQNENKKIQINLAKSFLLITKRHLDYRLYVFEAAFCDLAMFFFESMVNKCILMIDNLITLQCSQYQFIDEHILPLRYRHFIVATLCLFVDTWKCLISLGYSAYGRHQLSFCMQIVAPIPIKPTKKFQRFELGLSISYHMVEQPHLQCSMV